MQLARGDCDDSVKDLKLFLQRFGYYSRDPAARESLAAPAFDLIDDSTVNALERYQRFHGLPETGVFDTATEHLASLPRCGNPDFENFSLDGRKWNTTNLTYAIDNTPPGLTMNQVQAALQQALGLWSSVSPLRFTEVPSATTHDLNIRFVAGAHGDNSSFDGPGNVLAHAFFPPPNGGSLAGDAHFDTAETWDVVIPLPTGSFDLVTVAAHEFGHSMGLKHSNVSGALMFPTYSGPHRFLAADDVAGIQAIYGSGFLLQTGTAMHETDNTFDFTVAPNGDLFAIKKSNTGSNSTEIHVLSAASNYQQFVLQTGTALHETGTGFAFALAPNRDVIAIKKQNTGSNSTEVHVLSAASNYQQFSLQTGTALHETDGTFAFAVADNRDLFAIKKQNTGSNSTEVHVLAANGNYQQFSLQSGTALHHTGPEFSFAVASNRDVFAIKQQGTGTNSTEVHVLSAESTYSQFSLQMGTVLHETDDTFAFGLTAQRDLFAVKKSDADTDSTEVHIVDLP